MTTITPAFIVKQATAAKTGPRSKGGIGYQVLRDAGCTELMLMITSNEGGGYFSHEVVPFQKVIDSLKGIKADQPFAAKTFKTAFKGNGVLDLVAQPLAHRLMKSVTKLLIESATCSV